MSSLFVELVPSVVSPCFPFIEPMDVFPDVLVELVEVDIRQYGADNTTLRSSAVRSVEHPIFDVPGVKEFADKP